MSKKKSNTKPVKKAKDTLDANLVSTEEQQVNEAPKASYSGEVSLKDYSKSGPFAFNAKNYKLLLIGLAINVLGFILMIGGGSDDPNKFDGDALFSTMRITISPMFIVLGYLIIMYAIMKRPKTDQ